MRDLRVLTWLPIGSMLALVVLSCAAPSAVDRIALPIALTGAVLGVPHGAVDHLVPRWWGPTTGAVRNPVGSIGLFVVGYASAAALALVAFFAAPSSMLVAFLVLSTIHFGRGEVVTAAERRGSSLPGPRSEWTVTAAFGAAVVGLLLWAHPESVLPYLYSVSPWLAAATADGRFAGLTCTTLSVALGLVALLRAGHRREAVELALIVVAFSAAPPLAAFGVYFGLWHATRHTGRLLDLAQSRSATPIATGRSATLGSEALSPNWGQAARDLAFASAAPTVAALIVMAALWTDRELASLQSAVAVLLALTFPHAAVVWALDRRTPTAVASGQQPQCPRGFDRITSWRTQSHRCW